MLRIFLFIRVPRLAHEEVAFSNSNLQKLLWNFLAREEENEGVVLLSKLTWAGLRIVNIS